jgi:integrator complex subunit 6
VVNHKEEAGDEKVNHRGKRKAKVTKQNQHKHTNGLSSEKVLSNCLNILNGDDSFEEEEVEKWRVENTETRLQAFKEIRKFGRDYSGLYEQLEKIKGTYDMRFDFVQMCIVEANRFRRKQMVSCIQEWWEAQTEGKNGDIKLKNKS